MAEKVYKLSLEQLNDIVSDAVTQAIKKLDNVEIIDNETPPASDIHVGEFSEEQYQEAIKTMAANRGAGEEPKVGIFWYSPTLKQLFGVVTHKRTDYLRPNAGGGLITCSEMHEDVWKKEFYRQSYKGDGTGLYVGQYQDKPRGRVFYNINEDTFEVACGKWLQDYPHVYDMILQEFDLPPERTKAKYAIHWDIGQSWR